MNAKWSVATTWLDTGDGKNYAPANGDTLIFDPNQMAGTTAGTDQPSEDDIANLSLANLTINPGYTSTVTVDNDFTVTGNVTMRDGALSGAGKKLTVPNAASFFNWQAGTFGVDVTRGERDRFRHPGHPQQQLERGRGERPPLRLHQ
jgi:hypothetical protein